MIEVADTPKCHARPGSGITDRDAESLGPLLYQMALQGKADPQHLVEEARNPESPFHRYFTWDQQKAHEKLLRFEARRLIGSVMTTINGIEVRLIHAIREQRDEAQKRIESAKQVLSIAGPAPSPTRWASVDQIARDPMMLSVLEQEFMSYARAAQRRGRQLQAIEGYAGRFDRVLQAIEDLEPTA